MYIRSVRIYRVIKKININTEIAQEYARAKKLIEISWAGELYSSHFNFGYLFRKMFKILIEME